jgi:hypothetical protein
MKELPPIDGTPGKRIYTSIIADYDIKKALCELIDNVIDNGKNNDLPKVSVKISMNSTAQVIEISDTSGGVNELKNLVSPGATGNKPEDELIGIFGVGTKRATVALAKNICIKTRIRGDHTKILKYDEDWINSDNWSITPFVADKDEEEISNSETHIELTNLRKNFDAQTIKEVYDHLSFTYAFYIKEKFLEVTLNDTLVSERFFDNWTYSPKYPPTKYWGFIEIGGKKVKVEILAGLSNKSDPSGEWGVSVYCNKRLIVKGLKSLEVGFGKGRAGNPHPSASLANVSVFFEGEAGLMPWNSSKSDINYSHPIFRAIQRNLQDLVTTYAKVSRALSGEWNEELFKYASGNIEDKYVVFEKSLNRELPPLPAPKASEIIKIRDNNEKIFNSKPWTRGVFAGLEAEEIILRKDFQQRNRFLLIILDSTLEIGLKEFLVNESTAHYSDRALLDLFSSRNQVYSEIKKYPKGKTISDEEWGKIKYYNMIRDKILHQRAFFMS